MSRKERDPTHVEYYRIRSHVRSIMWEATCTVKKALNRASLLPARTPATDVDDYTQTEGTTAIVEKYRKLLKKTKQARLGQIILSGILPVCGNRIQGYRNSKRMAVNGMVEQLCKEEEVGYVDMWDSFVRDEELYFRDGLHLSGKGAAVLAEGLSGAVASGLGKVRYLN